MLERVYREYSYRLNRMMEFKIVGHAGKICYAFAPQNGRYWDYQDNGMIQAAQYWVQQGKLQFVLVDSIDQESWSDEFGDGRYRIEMQEKWFQYVSEELYTSVNLKTGNQDKGLTTGCSMGAVHAANFFFRRPDLFDSVIALSGTYDTSLFFHDYHDDLTYQNSPAIFLSNMPQDHPYMELYRQSKIIICIGQGNWEESLLPGTRRLDTVCKEKGIEAWFDYWGYDVYHDWPWWRKQLPYFLDKVLD